jgi:hypothetical protein
VVGAPGEYAANDRKGYVKVYRTARDGGNMTQIGRTIYGNVNGDLFGKSVDISADGKTVVIGSPGYWSGNDMPGYVRFYTLESSDDFDSNNWKPGQDIIGEAIGDEFGDSVSLSDDGKTLAVGAWGNDGNGESSGHVRIYRLEGYDRSWTQVGMDIDGESADESIGTSISLSRNGTTLAIGAKSSRDNGESSGYVKVYRINSVDSTWVQLGQTLNGTASYDYFGRFVEVSADGETLVIGSPRYIDQPDQPGYVRVYILVASSDNNDFIWKPHGQDITSEGTEYEFGSSGSLSDDGKTLCIGVNRDIGGGIMSSYARVYHYSNSTWMPFGEDIDGKHSGLHSVSLSLSADGNVIAIGSYKNDDNGADSGQVRIVSDME